ncbi:MAG: HhoA/HhoB/HtrA family serine endopeptidase [Cyanobacteria bacterium P01_A01_bin.116]
MSFLQRLLDHPWGLWLRRWMKGVTSAASMLLVTVFLLTNSMWMLPAWALAAVEETVPLAQSELAPSELAQPESATAKPAQADIAQVATPSPRPSAAGSVLAGESFVANAVRTVGNAVVRIDTERTVTRNVPDLFYDDPFFRGSFGNRGGGFQSIPQEEHLRGQGSGFIISERGDILTNAHVVDGTDQVTVKLKDGRSFEGYVEGIDEITDLAVVRIDTAGEPLPVSHLGDSDGVEVGDWAIAVGNPLGLDNTVTLGIVSTLKRSSAAVGIPDKRIDFIQTDAAINPGNSGGPLLNAQGEVIGINTAIRADAMGIGFAIPINKAKAIQASLSRGERIAHPYLGVQIATLTPDMAQMNNEDPNSAIELPVTNGVLVVRVLPNTPAAKAGLRRGDVITEIAGIRVKQADQLQSRVDLVKVGESLEVTLQRGDHTQKFLVKTADLSAQEEA